MKINKLNKKLLNSLCDELIINYCSFICISIKTSPNYMKISDSLSFQELNMESDILDSMFCQEISE
jgi:hypothetical protein